MYTAILRMAYLGDGISSDYDDYPETTEGGEREESVGEEPPPIPREDLDSGDEPEENE
ncbi:MAG: hypothetical protein V1696_00190 [Candidatus Jorgensenbacteria bacterium]